MNQEIGAMETSVLYIVHARLSLADEKNGRTFEFALRRQIVRENVYARLYLRWLKIAWKWLDELLLPRSTGTAEQERGN
jgi:hypothetical protein